jgi:hypothetical protein
VKPPNVWLEALTGGRSRAKVLDFGLARAASGGKPMTQEGAVVGTPAYMAPEQARGERVDARSDLFSLGCVLYRMATGEAPFRGADVVSILLAVVTHRPPAPRELAPEVPPALSDLIMRLLDKDPAGRPGSAREAADALRAVEHAPAAPPGAATISYVPSAAAPCPPARRFRRWALVGAMAAVAVLLLCLLLLVPVLKGWLSPAPGPDGGPPPSAGWKGSIDVLILDKDNPRRNNARLNAPDVLPLKPGDRFAVEAELDRPGYCYILWIDADGTVDPVYPWRPGHWEERPAEEQPVTRLRRPEALDRSYGIKESAPGMETLVLLVRATPLPRDLDLRAELGPVRAQAAQSLEATVWFQNGAVVKGDPGRLASWDEEKADDPVRQTQEQIRSRLGRWFQYTWAVSFAVRGK